MASWVSLGNINVVLQFLLKLLKVIFMLGNLEFKRLTTNCSKKKDNFLIYFKYKILQLHTLFHTLCFDITDLPLSFFPLRKSQRFQFRVVNAQGGRKVLFVRRKPSEQTGWWDNRACWAATNRRGWVLCFRESAENTKLLKHCAHLSNTDDTGLFIQHAAQPHTVNSWPATGLSMAIAGKVHLTEIILSGKNV